MVKSFTIRVSDELNEWLEEQAKIEHRKKNNLVVYLLELAKQAWLDVELPKSFLEDGGFE